MRRRVELAKASSGAAGQLSLRARCAALGVARSGVYDAAQQKKEASDTADILNLLREIYAQRPFQGYRRMTQDLIDKGYTINHKRVYRLMRLGGLQAVYPKKNLSKRRQEDAVFPYLLKERPPQKPHDCWCVDITYIKTDKGFVYMTALIDVVSRCIMGYSVSPFLDTESCLDALDMALKTGHKPKIINSDQGCQFTSQSWVYSLRLLGVDISMDGKGRCLDNIPIERFWRTLKYEEVYLKTYDTVLEATENLGRYITWYNHERRHSALKKQRPWEVMMGRGHGENAPRLHPMPTPPTAASTVLFIYKKGERNA